MSNEKRAQEAGPIIDERVKNHPLNKEHAGAAREGIPVRVLRMRVGQGLDIPGRNGEASCTSKPENFDTSVQYWKVEFQPWVRHHRVEFHPAGGDASKVQVVFLPEGLCSWEPL